MRKNLSDVSTVEIESAEAELLAADRSFFEVTDRQLNLEYVPPERARAARALLRHAAPGPVDEPEDRARIDGSMADGNFARDIEAWLETLAVDTSQTLQQSPTSTVVPTEVRKTAGRRAVAMLEQLSKLAVGATAQLKPGATIGEGGMGVVRLAEQVALGRSVAVKTLKSRQRDPAAALDLLREAWVTGALEHPNIVPVHDLGLDDDGSPRDRDEADRGRRVEHDSSATPAEVEARFGADRPAGVEPRHPAPGAQRGPLRAQPRHRPPRPQAEQRDDRRLRRGLPPRLGHRGQPARRRQRPPAAGAPTRTEMAGTPCYMAPEMLGRERGAPLSERTDVYLAGAVLFEIITGAPAARGQDRDRRWSRA